jgi:hypothetical protein
MKIVKNKILTKKTLVNLKNCQRDSKFCEALLSSVLAIVLVILLTGFQAWADEIEVAVNLRSEPKAALGIFFTDGKVVQQPNTNIERISDEVVLVRMPYEVSDLPSAAPFVTAMVTTEDDEVVFGDTRIVKISDGADSFWRLPKCETDVPSKKLDVLLPEQLNYLESLLQVRSKKREVAKQLLRDKMTPNILSRLVKVEKGLGLSGNDNELSADLPGLELLERLSRLKEAIILYQTAKDTQKAKADNNSAQ